MTYKVQKSNKFAVFIVLTGLITSLLFATSASSASAATTFKPVTIDVCGEKVLFKAPPKRVFSYDVNMLEYLVALGLERKIVAAWVYSQDTADELTPDFKARLAAAGVKVTVGKYPEMEPILNTKADFMFAGYNYGLRVGGEVNTKSLRAQGVKTYILKESCRHVNPGLGRSNMEDVYFDLRSLGAIFGVQKRANELISEYKKTIKLARSKVPAGAKPVSLFLYDSGEESPFTAGTFAIPTEMFRLAGGKNVIQNVPKTWTEVSWESVIAANPEVMPVVTYGGYSCNDRIKTLATIPGLGSITAIKNKQHPCFVYAEIVPGIRTADATLRLASLLWDK